MAYPGDCSNAIVNSPNVVASAVRIAIFSSRVIIPCASVNTLTSGSMSGGTSVSGYRDRIKRPRYGGAYFSERKNSVNLLDAAGCKIRYKLWAGCWRPPTGRFKARLPGLPFRSGPHAQISHVIAPASVGAFLFAKEKYMRCNNPDKNQHWIVLI